MTTALGAPHSDRWKESYTNSRYLESLTDDSLRNRYLELLNNVVGFTSDGTPHLNNLNSDTGWSRRIADVRAEVELRKLGTVWWTSAEQSVLERPYSRVKMALEAWGKREFTSGHSLIKYGRRKHMVDLLERGVLRLTPASMYDDPSLNSAIRDSELEFSTYFPPGSTVGIEFEPGSKVFEDIRIVGLIKNTNRCEDSYVFCASAEFQPRAFDDFDEYDACVLIHDYKTLVDLIMKQPLPARRISAASTVYVDPFKPHETAEIHFLKDFRFEYQHEWRIVWTDPIPTPPLQPHFLQLGDLRSFCELITL